MSDRFLFLFITRPLRPIFTILLFAKLETSQPTRVHWPFWEIFGRHV